MTWADYVFYVRWLIEHNWPVILGGLVVLAVAVRIVIKEGF